MVVRNQDEDALANEVLGDDEGGNTEQPPMDVDEDGRLAGPVDAADFTAPSDSNPFANEKAQASVNKPTGRVRDDKSEKAAETRSPATSRRGRSGIALDESPAAEAGTPGGDSAKAKK
jgi:hypothetical protein